MDRLEGKVAVVTGAASGLGRAMAERFAQEGMTVVIADNRVVEAETVAEQVAGRGGRAVAMEVDVTKRDSVVALADRIDAELGGASVLVNNAGVMSVTPLLEPEELGWRWIVEVNLFGVIYGVQTFVPRMLASGREGHVVNTASLGGIITTGGAAGNRSVLGERIPDRWNKICGYFATKHAVVAISEVLCADLAGTRLGVSVLCPSHHHDTGIYENSAKHRPEIYGGPMTSAEIGATARSNQRGSGAVTSVLSKSAARDPAECAARVVRAIRESHFYIFTHPENREVIEQRFGQMSAGLDDAAAFTPSAGL
jgi:NAD(P)-dependent dehydrogenase (short-subunit alcohol dehydrogenase family)